MLGLTPATGCMPLKKASLPKVIERRLHQFDNNTGCFNFCSHLYVPFYGVLYTIYLEYYLGYNSLESRI